MSYFLLSKSYLYTYKHLQILETNEPISPYISNSLHHYLCNIKEKINLYEKEWDIYKKYTNTYEYIHTNVPYKKKCISKYKPLSRAYFKMIELLYTFNIFNVYSSKKISSELLSKNVPILYSTETYPENHTVDASVNSRPIKTFHLAEGPGGFIEAIVKIRSNPNDVYIGMTIINNDLNDTNIPGWKKSNSFLKENKNVYIEPGIDNTGDILNIHNFIYCKEKYKSNMDFITADGGFDFSIDFNSQEINISRLLFAQIAYAICMQKKNGTFILKIFDIFMIHTIDLIYLLSSFYKKVYVSKPNTSRLANSEKYVVCQQFIFDSCDEFYPYFLNAFHQMSLSNKFIYRFLCMDIPTIFLNKIEEINSIMGQQQIENIHNTISIIETKNKNDKIDGFIRNNIQKCIQWCVKHNIPYHIFTQTQPQPHSQPPTHPQIQTLGHHYTHSHIHSHTHSHSHIHSHSQGNPHSHTHTGFIQSNPRGNIQHSFSNRTYIDIDANPPPVPEDCGNIFITKPISTIYANKHKYNNDASASIFPPNKKSNLYKNIMDMENVYERNKTTDFYYPFHSKKIEEMNKSDVVWTSENFGKMSNIFLDNTKNIDADIDNRFLQHNINTIHNNLYLSQDELNDLDPISTLTEHEDQPQIGMGV